MKPLIAVLFAGVCLAQTTVKISEARGEEGYTTITHFTSGNPDYICKAKSTQNPQTITVSAISNANTGVMTATGHGFYYASGTVQKFVAFISGLTGNWAPLNGIHVLTPASADTLTTDVDTTTFGDVTGTVSVQTRAPKATATVWSVQVIAYDASGNPVLSMWAAPTTAGTKLASLYGGSTAYAFACAMPGAYQ